MESKELRDKIHKAIAHFAKMPVRFEAKGDPFLSIASPKGHALELYEDEGEIELEFGVSGESFSFNPELDEEGEESDLPNEKEILSDVLKTVMAILDERLFAAQYKKGQSRVSGLFMAREFDELSKKPEFVAISWGDKYTRGDDE